MENKEFRKEIEQEVRNFTSAALFNNLYWWASGTQEPYENELQRALWLIDEIF